MEQTVILIKPDGMKRGLIGKVIQRFEEVGFKLVAAKLLWLTDEILNDWYVHHQDKDFFPSLCAFMKECPVLAMVWEGEGILVRAREICGATDPAKAEKGTIRADFGTEIQRNVVHVSDSAEAVEKELALIFSQGEIFDY